MTIANGLQPVAGTSSSDSGPQAMPTTANGVAAQPQGIDASLPEVLESNTSTVAIGAVNSVMPEEISHCAPTTHLPEPIYTPLVLPLVPKDEALLVPVMPPTASSSIRFVRSGEKYSESSSGPTYPLACYDPPGEHITDDINPFGPALPREPGAKVILSESFSTLKGKAANEERIDITQVATPERYRFIDCTAFVQGETLVLLETVDFPQSQFAAISHIWKGLPAETDSQLASRGEFLVECEARNDGGPISVDVLYYTCLACLRQGIQLLWLNRLCIMQAKGEASKQDKRWQIMHMYDIYKKCSLCLVLAAGLQRFPFKAEETEWIERAWTFQEVMVPPVVKVLYLDFIGAPPTLSVLSLNILQYFALQLQIYDDARDGSRDKRQQFYEALGKCHQYREPTSNYLERFQDIWEFMQWRKSTRMVDVVLSVMGLLGVQLDPAQFRPYDRLKATVALAERLLMMDDSRNACIDIPLWRRLSKSKLDQARQNGVNLVEFTADIPNRVRLLDLEQELDPQSIGRFVFSSRRSVGPLLETEEWRGDAEAVRSDELNDVNAVVMSGGQKQDAFRLAFRTKVATSRWRSDRIRSEIPSALLHKARGPLDERIIFKPPSLPAIELCPSLWPSPNADSTMELPREPGGRQGYVFGWTIQYILWLRLGRHGRPRNDDVSFDFDQVKSAPVPIITFFKFAVD